MVCADKKDVNVSWRKDIIIVFFSLLELFWTTDCEAVKISSVRLSSKILNLRSSGVELVSFSFAFIMSERS
jgi:hypothetical protein